MTDRCAVHVWWARVVWKGMRVKRQERKGKSNPCSLQAKSCSIIVHLLLIITIADYQLCCKRAPPKENKQNGLQPRGEFHRIIESQKQEVSIVIE